MRVDELGVDEMGVDCKLNANLALSLYGKVPVN